MMGIQQDRRINEDRPKLTDDNHFEIDRLTTFEGSPEKVTFWGIGEMRFVVVAPEGGRVSWTRDWTGTTSGKVYNKLGMTVAYYEAGLGVTPKLVIHDFPKSEASDQSSWSFLRLLGLPPRPQR